MRLALLGYPITHSLSPKLYRDILGDKLLSYDLLSFEKASLIPPLKLLANRLDGLSITSPYKTHFFNELIIDSKIVRSLGAVNTIAFREDGFFGTNTDVIAVEDILKRHVQEFGDIFIIILGGGVMGQVTKLICDMLAIDYVCLTRTTNPDLSSLDLRTFRRDHVQNIIINASSREFLFKGELSREDIFWDYNYSFYPHRDTIPKKVKAYQDGQVMLELQARAAVKFWIQTNSKLKC